MKLLKYELNIKRKKLLFWSIGLLLLYISGSMEFEGIKNAGEGSIDVVINYYPKIVLALMGITEAIDFSVLDGYTWVLGYFGTLLASFYAITLGLSVVNQEFSDKTFEFLFTKPKSRKKIMGIKILSGFICITLFCLVNLIGSLLIMNPIDKSVDITKIMSISSMGTYLSAIVFYALSLFIATLIKSRAKGAKVLYFYYLFTTVAGAVYDVVDNKEFLRVINPLRYFLHRDAIKGSMNIGYIALTIVLSFVLIILSLDKFNKRDLTEI